MAHRSRERFVADLLDRLELEPDRVAWDTDGNRWHTGRRAWELADPSATHHLVIQDDALVCRDLVPGLERALAQLPGWTAADGTRFGPDTALLSPYTGTRRPLSSIVENTVTAAEQAGAPWIVMRALMWGVAIGAPTAGIDQMLAWCDRQPYPNYDRRVGRYYYLVKAWPVWATHPSLVDHRDHAEAPSLCGHGPGRVAHKFHGLESSALGIDWTGPPVVLPGMAQLDHHRRSNLRNGPPAHG